MARGSQRMFAGLMLLGMLLPVRGLAADKFTWTKDKVTADVDGWKLPELLERIHESTNWDIFLEPDTTITISARFSDQVPGEALRRMLGNLNFALLPQTNAPARLFIFRTSLQEATQQVKFTRRTRSRTGKPIDNELVVALKPGADIKDIAKKVGADVLSDIDDLGVYRLGFDDAESAQLARDLLAGYDSVADIDSNYYVERPPGAELLAAGSSSQFNLNPAVGGDGSQLIVGLIDTAIQRNNSPISQLLLPSLSVFGAAADPGGYSPTHATAMANALGQGMSSVLSGTDTTVRILPVDVYGAYENATTFDVAHGIVLAIQNGATVINLSLGSEGNSALLQTVIQNGSDKGVMFIAAAGNQPVDTPFYPAAYSQVLAVTAGNRQGYVAPYANYGSFVDVVAPGSSMVSYNSSSFLVSGTSASSAYVSGLAAGLATAKGLSLSAASTQIRSTFGYNLSR